MGDDADVQPPGCFSHDEADPMIVEPGPDDRVKAESSDTGSLASGIKTRKQLEKEHGKNLTVMGVSFMPSLLL